ncbi:hypothetical protein J6590_068655 [Homalodisca vitripennis]|nr:hypothetical protein J6590_068655 [Homalodisca vitripennis]
MALVNHNLKSITRSDSPAAPLTPAQSRTTFFIVSRVSSSRPQNASRISDLTVVVALHYTTTPFMEASSWELWCKAT